MTWSDYDSTACSVARTMQVLGDRWTMVVVRDLFNGVRRFDELQAHLGIARDVLARRLALLVDEGIAEKRPVRVDGGRTRHEYVLTGAGRELRTVLVAIMDWGDRHRSGQDGPPMGVRHLDCGEPVHAALHCDAGHPIEASERTQLVALAGARRRST